MVSSTLPEANITRWMYDRVNLDFDKIVQVWSAAAKVLFPACRGNAEPTDER
jgi:hypothetical protein